MEITSSFPKTIRISSQAGLLFCVFLLPLATSLAVTETTPLPQSQTQSYFSKLTPVEQQEFTKARQQALQDPAVQTARRITRMTLHKAMLRVNPSIHIIFANMNAHAPKNGLSLPYYKKNSGLKFQDWLANYPLESTQSLTPADLKTLKVAHQQALQDPAVQSARKTAHITFYNALINANPAIGPILTKAGVATPKSVTSAIQESKIGSEEKILGGNFDAWDTDILVPAVEKMTPALPTQK